MQPRVATVSSGLLRHVTMVTRIHCIQERHADPIAAGHGVAMELSIRAKDVTTAQTTGNRAVPVPRIAQGRHAEMAYASLGRTAIAHSHLVPRGKRALRTVSLALLIAKRLFRLTPPNDRSVDVQGYLNFCRLFSHAPGAQAAIPLQLGEKYAPTLHAPLCRSSAHRGCRQEKHRQTQPHASIARR